MYSNVINRHFRTRFIAIISVLLLLALSISAAFFYYYANKELGDTYREKIYTIAQFRAAIIKDTLLIFISPLLISAIFIIITIILYTHRIVGPLVRIRTIAQQITEGNLEILVKFRRKDAIKALADSLNNLSVRYKDRYSRLNVYLEELYKDANEMRQFIEKGEAQAVEDVRKKTLRKAEEIRNMLSEIRL